MSLRSRGVIPPRGPVAPMQRPALPPAPAPAVRAPTPAPAALAGDPGFGNGLGVSGADLRRLIGPIESAVGELQHRLAAVESSAAGVGVLQELLQSRPNPVSGADMLAGLGEGVVAGIRGGRCLPYFAGIDVFVPKGVSGVQVPAGEIFISSDGPMFITQLLAFAQIDSDDADAANYPYSLIQSPSCSAGSSDAFTAPDDSTFVATPTTLLPSLNAQGRFIPTSPLNCKILSPTVQTTCYTRDCADGSTPAKFAGQVPVVLLDHPECVDGLVDIQTNGCLWQNQSFPIGLFEDTMFNITNDTPDPLGVCGFLDCNKRLDVRFQPTRGHRYDINLTIVFAGFRVITCGAGACGIG